MGARHASIIFGVWTLDQIEYLNLESGYNPRFGLERHTFRLGVTNATGVSR